jgi:hypothetical protein
MAFELIRKYRRYHRLIDRSAHIWFYALQEGSMKPLARPTHRVIFGAGVIAFIAMVVLALSAAAARRVAPATQAGAAVQSAKEVRGASPYIEIKNEPAPKLIVDCPLPDLLDDRRPNCT